MIDWSKSNLDEMELFSKIAKRAIKLIGKGSVQSFAMNLQAVHTHGCKLKLEELLKSRDSDILHDVFGIDKHIDRDTGKLCDCFWPRFAVAQ